MGTHSQPVGVGVLGGPGVTEAYNSSDTLGGKHMFQEEGKLGNGAGSTNLYQWPEGGVCLYQPYVSWVYESFAYQCSRGSREG